MAGNPVSTGATLLAGYYYPGTPCAAEAAGEFF